MSPYSQYLAVLFISLAVSIGLQMAIPYPYGLIVSLGLFIAFPLIYKKIVLKVGKGAGRFGGIEHGTNFAMVCMVCGKKSKERQCSRCGSKAFRMS